MVFISGLWRRISWVNSCKVLETMPAQVSMSAIMLVMETYWVTKEKGEKTPTWFRPGLGRCGSEGFPRGVTSNWGPKNEPESEWWRVRVRSLLGQWDSGVRSPSDKGEWEFGGNQELGEFRPCFRGHVSTADWSLVKQNFFQKPLGTEELRVSAGSVQSGPAQEAKDQCKIQKSWSWKQSQEGQRAAK